MTTNFPYHVSDRSVTAFVGGKTYVANSDHPNFSKIKDALKAGVTNTIPFIALFSIAKTVEAASGGRVTIDGNNVLYDGEPVRSTLTTRMVEMMREGCDMKPLVAFMENLYQNPSYRCVNSVYDFLDANKVPITPDGCILVFKKVRGDWFDIHSRTVLNKPFGMMTKDEAESLPQTMGKSVLVSVENGNTVISVARNMVDENIDQTCSYGLHVCAEHYLPSFSNNNRDDHVLICKVNPRDIVANPRDYRNAKLRVCRYEIVGELPPEKATTYFSSSVMTGTEDWNSSAPRDDRYDNVGTLGYDEPRKEDTTPPTIGKTVQFLGFTLTVTSEFDEWSGEDCFVILYKNTYGIDASHPTNVENDGTEEALQEALNEFREFCVDEEYIYTVECVAFDDDANVIVGTVDIPVASYSGEDFAEGEGPASDKIDFDLWEVAELFHDKYPHADFDTVRIKTFTLKEVKRKLV